eukprot:CAMPEP_0169114032 /NCGR_PEP_ID=MMETSP1015-20121227/28527_1 /TAXON_ID=342587 /ORGANISM="Karlodinium micrum, Strain CCMP2283" /LENGTH=34 /DNA_ID= /DNA_START= /DNA_END= /DNA_ORIENTATION=
MAMLRAYCAELNPHSDSSSAAASRAAAWRCSDSF